MAWALFRRGNGTASASCMLTELAMAVDCLAPGAVTAVALSMNQ